MSGRAELIVHTVKRRPTRVLLSLGVSAGLVTFAAVCPSRSLGQQSRPNPANSQEMTGAGFAHPAPPETSEVSRALKPVLSDYEVIRLEPGDVRQQVWTSGELRFRYKETVFDFKLEPHDLRASDYQAVETGPGGVRRVLPRGPVTTFKGRLAGQQDTHGRFALTRQGVEGVVFTAEGRYYLEPLQRYLAGAKGAELVVYRHSDIKFDSDWKCGLSLPMRLKRGIERVEAQGATVTATKYQVEVATEADYEYVQALGDSDKANAEILSILNMVDGIYQSEFLLELSVTFQNTWTTDKDPYSATAHANLLSQFQTYWNKNFAASKDYDVAHLWTGKNLDGNVFGTAWVGFACRSRVYSYALSERKTSVPLKYVLPAHEIAHTFGANHPDEASPPAAGCANTAMTSNVSRSKLTFCEYSREEVASHVSSRNSCLTTRSITLQPPSSLTGSGLSSSQVNLSWQDNSSNETGFKVHRRLGNSANWNEAGSVAADATTFSDSGLSPETTYRYRVRAFNDTESSAFSNEAKAATLKKPVSPPPPPPPPSPPPPPPTPPPPSPPPGGGGGGFGGGGFGGGGGAPRTSAPSAPRNLTAEAGDGEVVLTWEPPLRDGGADITDYEYRVDRRNPWVSTGSDDTTYTVTGLVNGATYLFEVRAVNSAGKSFPSNRLQATPTDPEPQVFTLDFPHFANGGGITSEVVLLNVGNTPNLPVLYFSDPQGASIDADSVVEVKDDLEVTEDGGLTVGTAIEPLGEFTVATHGRGAEVSGSVRLVAEGAPLGGVLRYGVPMVGVTGVGAGAAVRDALFPARRQQGGIRTAAALNNPGEAAIKVSCELMSGGAVLEQATISLEPNGQRSWFLEDEFTMSDTRDFVGTVRCRAPGEGEYMGLAVEVDAANRIFTTLPVVPIERRAGQGGPTVLHFAHFANGGNAEGEGIRSELVFVNVQTEASRPAPTPFHRDIPASRPVIYFYDREGRMIDPESVVDLTDDLEVQEDGGLAVRTEMAPLGELTITTHGRGEEVSGSVKVVSEGAIGGVLRYSVPGVGVTGVGTGPAVRDALFPARRKQGRIRTAAAIRNLGEEAMDLTCRLMRGGAVLEETTISLEPNGQTSWFIEDEFTATDTTDFAGTVRCTAPGEGSEERMFTGLAVEVDAANRIFTTLPVVPVEERMPRQ